MHFLLFMLFFSQFLMINYLLRCLIFRNPRKCIYILRGLPGSGKTSYISKIVDKIKNKDSYRICNYQDYLDANNPRDIPKSYTICFNMFMDYLDDYSIKTIFIDNPNIESWEYQNYIDLVNIYGYDVKIVEISCPDYNYIEYFWSRTSTKITLENMKSMWNRWEENDEDNNVIYREPYVEMDISSQGDCLPYPEKTLEELDIELDEIQKKID